MSTLRNLRNNAGLSLRQVEELTSISNSYLSQLENGKIRRPSAQALYVLSKLYNYNIEKLLIESGLVKDLKITPVEMISSNKDRIDNLEKRIEKIEAYVKVNSNFKYE